MTLRAFVLIAAALLCSMAGFQLHTAANESQTFDEGMHLAAGYSYWKTGDYRLNPEHPPLSKLLAALPLLTTGARLPTEHPAWESRDQGAFAEEFVYRNRVPGLRLLFLGRLATIAVSLLLGIVLAWWTRARFGDVAALLALFLYATDPNFIAHGHYITSDVFSAAGFFVTIAAWDAALRWPAWLRVSCAGLALGAALAAKFSTIVLLPILAVLVLVHAWKSGFRQSRATVLRLSAASGIAAAVILVAYGPTLSKPLPRLADAVDRTSPAGYAFHRLGKATRMPAHPYLLGVYEVAKHNEGGHPTYLLGRISDTGDRRYFPIAFLVKTPIAVLLLLLISIVGARAAFRRDWLAAIAILGAATTYFTLSVFSNIQIGLRHLLPVYPFLYAWIGAAIACMMIAGRLRVALIAVAVLIQLVEVGRIHPHYTAFFNAAAGGPLAGPRYLLDSNIDWGQDLIKLKREFERRGVSSVCVAFFSPYNPQHYGVPDNVVPWTIHEDRKSLDCLAAVSVNLYHDLYLPPGSYQWLREKKPDGHVGYSVYLFDMRKAAAR